MYAGHHYNVSLGLRLYGVTCSVGSALLLFLSRAGTYLLGFRLFPYRLDGLSSAISQVKPFGPWLQLLQRRCGRRLH